MIFRREDLPEYIINNGKIYTCDYEYVKLTEGTIMGSNDLREWYPLSGREILGFDRSPKPSIVMEKEEDYNPLEW